MDNYVLKLYLDEIAPANLIAEVPFKADGASAASSVAGALGRSIASQWVADGSLLWDHAAA